jgi:hypothetical protein
MRMDGQCCGSNGTAHLHVEDVWPIVERHGFGLELGPDARQRVKVRDYSKDMVAA